MEQNSIIKGLIYRIKYYRHFYDTEECINTGQIFRDKMEENKI